MMTFEEQAFKDEGWLQCVSDLLALQEVQEMKKFKHHKQTTCFTHCVHVSYACYLYFEKHHKSGYEVARCGLLHDLFLYQREQLPTRWLRYTHVFTHGKKAMRQAMWVVDLTKRERIAIARHMFPLTLIPPTNREGIAICIWDKLWGIKEFRGVC